MLFDEQIARRYEAWYEAGEGRRADALEKALLLKMVQGFPGARDLLEVGCGTGHFTRWFARLGLRAVGLDLSPAMLAEARGRDGIPLILGDAACLPFADGSFELVALI
ncbi:MAG TPA: class I SAM-dependent methyltransferase, partial [Anaerolineae bacterium]|nr:class I SAM-dependent methyltransferase [Anaerolineae bacterium]